MFDRIEALGLFSHHLLNTNVIEQLLLAPSDGCIKRMMISTSKTLCLNFSLQWNEVYNNIFISITCFAYTFCFIPILYVQFDSTSVWFYHWIQQQ